MTAGSRHLGSGHARMQLGLDAWNGLGGRLEPSRASDVFVVANDVVGGFFALDSGRLGIGRGRLAYLAPDTMRWEDMDMGDSEFLQWLADGDLAGFAEGVGWRGVRHPDAPRGRRDLRRPAAVGGGAADLRAGSGADPMTELWTYVHVTMQRLEAVPPGSPVRLSAFGQPRPPARSIPGDVGESAGQSPMGIVGSRSGTKMSNERPGLPSARSRKSPGELGRR
ncbi:MAG TPA: DUF2625 family protein [Actinomycetota bacterium]